MRVEVWVNLGPGPNGVLSGRDLVEHPHLAEEFRERVSPDRGRVFLDGHLAVVSGEYRFLGVDYLIENFDTSLILLEAPVCSQGSQEMFLDSGRHTLTATGISQTIRFEVKRRSTGNVVERAEFKAQDLASEWFLGWARLMRIAAELGDEYSSDQVTASFRALCSEYQTLVGEDRLMAVLNDPFEKVMRREKL